MRNELVEQLAGQRLLDNATSKTDKSSSPNQSVGIIKFAL
jgi:hypothetical protein